MAAGYHPGQLNGYTDGFRSPWTKQRFIKISRGDLCQFLSQFYSNLVGITARAKRKLIYLFFDGFDHLRIGEAYLMDIVTVKIHIAASLRIFNVNAFAAAHGVQARSG